MINPRPIALSVVVFVTGACTTCPEPSYEPDEVLTEDAEASVYQPILLSRQDVLTKGTKAAILGHNNTYWCRNEDERPEGFDADAIC